MAATSLARAACRYCPRQSRKLNPSTFVATTKLLLKHFQQPRRIIPENRFVPALLIFLGIIPVLQADNSAFGFLFFYFTRELLACDVSQRGIKYDRIYVGKPLQHLQPFAS